MTVIKIKSHKRSETDKCVNIVMTTKGVRISIRDSLYLLSSEKDSLLS